MENYVDNPDRTNAPTREYCRISDSVIENALTYENEHPNIVVLVRADDGEGLGLHEGHAAGRHARDQHALLAGLHDSVRARS